MGKTRSLSLSEAFFTSFMVGAGECFFAAFVLAQGLGEIFSGFVIAGPMIMGALLQVGTPTLQLPWKNPKAWVLLCCTLQILCLVSLALLPATPWMILLIISLYWAFSFSLNAVWNYWMGFLVLAEDQSQYFAERFRLTQYGILFGLFFGGWTLHFSENQFQGYEFVVLFLGAAAARLLSLLLLAGHQEKIFESSQIRLSSWLSFFNELKGLFSENPQIRRDLKFLFVFNVLIFITSSFVTAYLLKHLHFGYLSFMAAQQSLFLGKILALWLAPRWIKQFGVRQVLFWGALGMSPLPVVWLLVERTWSASLLQGVSGFAWGLFEVTMALVFFSELSASSKIQLLCWNSLGQALAILLGTLVGGFVLHQFFEQILGYFVIFAVGGVLRTIWVLKNRRALLARV